MLDTMTSNCGNCKERDFNTAGRPDKQNFVMFVCAGEAGELCSMNGKKVVIACLDICWW